MEDAAQANTGLSSRLCRLFLIFLPFLPVGCPCYGKQDFLETIPISNWAVNILFILNWYLSINVIHVTEALLSQAIPEGTFSRARHFLNTGEEPSEPWGKQLEALIISNYAPRNHQVKRNKVRSKPCFFQTGNLGHTVRRPLDGHWGFRNSHGTGALYALTTANQSINQSTNQSCLGRILTLYQEELTLTQLCFLFQTKLSLDYTQDKNYQVLQPLMVSINSSDVGRTEHLSKWCWKTAWKGYNLSFCSIDTSSFRIRCIFHPFPINNFSEQALLGILHRENPSGQFSSFLFCPANVAQRSPFFLPDPPEKHGLHVYPLPLDHEG